MRKRDSILGKIKSQDKKSDFVAHRQFFQNDSVDSPGVIDSAVSHFAV